MALTVNYRSAEIPEVAERPKAAPGALASPLRASPLVRLHSGDPDLAARQPMAPPGLSLPSAAQARAAYDAAAVAPPLVDARSQRGGMELVSKELGEAMAARQGGVKKSKPIYVGRDFTIAQMAPALYAFALYDKQGVAFYNANLKALAESVEAWLGEARYTDIKVEALYIKRGEVLLPHNRHQEAHEITLSVSFTF